MIWQSGIKPSSLIIPSIDSCLLSWMELVSEQYTSINLWQFLHILAQEEGDSGSQRNRKIPTAPWHLCCQPGCLLDARIISTRQCTLPSMTNVACIPTCHRHGNVISLSRSTSWTAGANHSHARTSGGIITRRAKRRNVLLFLVHFTCFKIHDNNCTCGHQYDQHPLAQVCKVQVFYYTNHGQHFLNIVLISREPATSGSLLKYHDWGHKVRASSGNRILPW